nr:thioredoxin fold domain-containing protein [uncultured Caldimonas sp.]
MIPRRLLRALLGTCALLGSLGAQAGGQDAIQNLFNNLARAKASVGVTADATVSAPTPVKGIYAVTDRQGRFIGYTNEAGTLFGDSRGFNVLSPNGAQPRPITAEETAQLRVEIMNSIDYDRLVKVTYGDGGGRRILLFSAVDCPHCKTFEDGMRGVSQQVNTTFYVVPSALQPLNKGGAQTWQVATRIWCAEDPGEAWLSFWEKRAVPAQRKCHLQPKTSELLDRQIKDLLQAAGMRISGTPRLIAEDGTRVLIRSKLDAAFVEATYGPTGRPSTSLDAPRWLASGGEASAAVQSTEEASDGSGQKVNLGDALKKLFK